MQKSNNFGPNGGVIVKFFGSVFVICSYDSIALYASIKRVKQDNMGNMLDLYAKQN